MFLIDFISGPVSAGFTSAAAIVIATSQLKDLLGINIKSNSFIGFWDQLAMHIKEISIGDGTLGITCMVVLLLLRVSYIHTSHSMASRKLGTLLTDH